jgi:peptide/nickel transport system substrate-binding protein
VAAIALAACDPMNFRTAAAQVSQIVARCASSPKTFNYAFLSSYPNIFGFTFEGLLDESKAGELRPALAESWKISDDKLHIIFTLRPGLQWSDGHPLTAKDVLFSFKDVYLNEKIPTDLRDSLKIGQSGALPKVQALNDRQIEFTLPEPFAPFLRAVKDSIILPAHILRPTVFENDKDGKPKFISTWGTDTDPSQIIVNGPYRLVSYVPSQRLVFERNPHYWRKDARGKQLPYIDRIVWQIIEASDTALLQFRSQGLDMLTIGPGSFSLLKRQEKPGNYTIHEAGPDSGTSFIGFNLNQGQRNGQPLVDPIKSRWFNTKEFRQAIAYAIDRQTMINNIYRGLGKPQNSPISVQSPYYRSPEAGLKTYDYNPEKAKQLLKSAGFKYNPQGQLLDADGHRVRFTLSANSGSRLFEAVLSQIKQNLGSIGIQLDLQLIDFSILVDKLSNSLDLEMYALGFSGGVEPNGASNLWMPEGGSHMFNQKPQKEQPPISGQKVADWEAKIGQLFIQAAKELDEPKRKALYGEMQQIAQEQVPLIYLVNPLVMAAIRNRVQGVQLSPLFYEGSLWNAYELKTTD